MKDFGNAPKQVFQSAKGLLRSTQKGEIQTYFR